MGHEDQQVARPKDHRSSTKRSNRDPQIFRTAATCGLRTSATRGSWSTIAWSAYPLSRLRWDEYVCEAPYATAARFRGTPRSRPASCPWLRITRRRSDRARGPVRRGSGARARHHEAKVADGAALPRQRQGRGDVAERACRTSAACPAKARVANAAASAANARLIERRVRARALARARPGPRRRAARRRGCGGASRRSARARCAARG